MNNKKVIIYQMGKVASSSLLSSLSQINKLDVVHTHHLNSRFANEMNIKKKSMGWEITVSPDEVESLFSEINSYEGELIIITSVREPIGRNISAYFENLDNIYRQKNIHSRLSQKELINGFFNKYPHSIPIIWFDREMKETLGIDVFKYNFPKKEGTLIINEGKYKLLIMHFDIDDSLKQKNIEKVLNIGNIPIVCKNIGAMKPYGDTYKRFVNSIILPNTYLTEMLDSKYARHFFENSVLDSLRKKWGR